MLAAMTIEQRIGRHRVGGWDFMPVTGELRRRSDVRRLEPRAAKVLELLCEARGEIVTQERLIDQVWDGRLVSENSIAVVIGQLRRALDDDAREPRLIETMPKRGYRLLEGGVPSRKGGDRRWLLAGLAGLATVALLAVGVEFAGRPAPLEVTMTDVANQTGDARYDPLARATSELMVTDLSKRGFTIRRGAGGGLTLRSKLVMWNGAPSLGMSASDSSGLVLWSAMTDGTAANVPYGVAQKLDDFKARFGTADARLAPDKRHR